MPSNLFTFISQPGVRRDGTELDSPYYADGVWVRWQRGKPRKMGGYRATNLLANGPTRHVVVDARNGAINAHYFSPWGIQRQGISDSGAAGALDDRTPLVFAPSNLYTWTSGFMFSSVGSTFSALIACSTPDCDAIDSDSTGNIYFGDATKGDPMSVLQDGSGAVAVSGGVCVLQPFLFAYGSNGLIKNTKQNDLSSTGWVTGGGSLANTVNVSGTKIIYGAPIRGGSASPAGLFWALDSLIRVSFVGGTAIWNYDPLATPGAPLSKRAIVEVDGKFIWPAIDRFLMYTGVIQELPNDMNQNWFFDNLNFSARNKVWGTKIPRFGEIWWFYPRGSATECTDAVIYNYRENSWYDAHLTRSAGDKAGVFKFPVWAGSEDGVSTLRLTVGTRSVESVLAPAGLGAPSQNAATSLATGGTGLGTGTTYFYKITAINAAGESLSSNEVSVTTAGGIVAPAATTISTTNTGGTALNSATTYFYKVTALNGAGETTASNELSVTTAAGISNPTATTLVTAGSGGTGLAASTQYFYKVTATNALGETMGSNELNVTTGAGLSAPTLSAPSSSSGGSLSPSTTYFYKVTALNAVGETLPSGEQSVTTGGSTSAPVLGTSSYTIDGNDPTGFVAGTTYFYKVTAIAASGESLGSNEISVAVPSQVAAPTARAPSAATTAGGSVPLANYDCYVVVFPFTGVGHFITSDATFLGNVTVSGSNRQIVLQWNLASRDDGGYAGLIRNTATGVVSYNFVVSGVNNIFIDGTTLSNWIADGGKWPQTNDTAKGTVNLSWGAVAGATTYKIYRGTASGVENLVKTAGNVTSFADRGDATTSGSPPSTGLSARLTWGAITGATAYKVYRGTTAGGENVFYAPGNVTSYTDTGATVDGTAAPPASNTTIKPTNTLSWNAVTGATSYNVYRGTAAGSENVKYALGAVTTFSDTGASGSALSPPGSNTTGGLSTNTVHWGAVTGATSYRVYRGTAAGAEGVYYAVSGGGTTSFADVGGAPTASASPPGSNTTASATSSNVLGWLSVPGATGYKVYRGTAPGAETVFYSPGLVTSYTDTGSAGSAGSPPAHNTTSVTLTFAAVPAGVVAGMTVHADPLLAPNTTVVSATSTTVVLSDSPLLDVPVGTLVAFSTQNGISMANGQTVTGASSGASGTLLRSSYVDLNLGNVGGTFTNGETLNVSDGHTAKLFAPVDVQNLDAVYQQEFGVDKIVAAKVEPILSSFTSQNYGIAVGSPFKPTQAVNTTDIMTRITRLEPDFNLVGDATLIIEGRSFAQQPNKELQRYTIHPAQEFQDMREQERILRVTFQSNSVGGFFEQGQVLMALEPGDERSDVST